MKNLLALLLLGTPLILSLGSTALTAAEPASIAGVVWEDRNLDGVRQADEPGLPRLYLQLETAGATSGSTLTDDNGTYRFENLPPGQYTIRAGFGYPAMATYPAKSHGGPVTQSVTLNESPVSGVDFGFTVEFPRLSGTAWVNGTEANQPVVAAFVGQTQCGFVPRDIIKPTDTGPGLFMMYFVPPGFIPACDAPGASVRFTIDGVIANETIPYPPVRRNDITIAPPSQPQPVQLAWLNLTVGGAFAVYTGDPPWLIVDGEIAGFPPGELRALINGLDCGIPQFAFGPVRISVLSAEVRPGCGTEGAAIDFYFGDARVNETVTWTAGFHDLEVTLPESALVPPPNRQEQQQGTSPARRTINPPDTGDAGLRAAR